MAQNVHIFVTLICMANCAQYVHIEDFGQNMHIFGFYRAHFDHNSDIYNVHIVHERCTVM